MSKISLLDALAADAGHLVQAACGDVPVLAPKTCEECGMILYLDAAESPLGVRVPEAEANGGWQPGILKVGPQAASVLDIAAKRMSVRAEQLATYVLYQALSGREFVCRPGLAYVRETGDLTQVVFTDHLGDVWTMLLGPEDLHLFAAMRDRVSALLAAARTPTPNAPTTKTLQ